ncbi:ubiquitin-like protein Pup [Rothia sp. p3-SID1597]|nr:ubiquitin-like protein Pup [Rothia sp. p3-SID1597]
MSLVRGEHSLDHDLVSETDDILDEIDSVLEENAEDYVRGFVQKGGQ